MAPCCSTTAPWFVAPFYDTSTPPSSEITKKNSTVPKVTAPLYNSAPRAVLLYNGAVAFGVHFLKFFPPGVYM
jgi:hypothetical protein